MISVGLPVAANNPVPASQVGFQQFRAIERFCVEGSSKRSDRGHSSMDLEFVTDRAFRASFSIFRKLVNPVQVTSKHKTVVVLAQSGQILFIPLYWTNWQVLCNIANLLKFFRSEKTTCWFWKIFYMMKNKSNFPNINVGSALNKFMKN